MPEGISVQMTIGRAVDAQGNIHLEGKGVVPTVKVPVTADILQKQANGEDVVLAAAENALKTTPPPGAGVTPSGKPTLATQMSALGMPVPGAGRELAVGGRGDDRGARVRHL